MRAKKILMMIVAVCAISLTACTSKADSLINKYEKALENKDVDTAIEIDNEFDRLRSSGDLSAEQDARIDQIDKKYDDVWYDDLMDKLD